MCSPRVALYGHDTVGLGHLRRNLGLAGSFSRMSHRPDVLIVSGAASEAMSFPLPAGVDLLAVPGVTKDHDGGYGSRRLSVGLDAVIRMRSAAIAAALDEFAPDLLVVDKLPLGLGGELESALRTLRDRHGTRVVLGLRDVLDAPSVARSEWRAARMTEAVRAFFDEIWVYGDAAVHDVAESCGLPPALRAMVRYTGYLSRGSIVDPATPPMLDDHQRYVMCTVGGGTDGADIAGAFAAAALPAGVSGILVAGPQMPARERVELEGRLNARDDLVFVPFHPDVARWLPAASAAVTMGGYNAVAEVLSTTTPGLVVPRSRPRAEQLVRARAMAARGLIETLAPADATPEAVSAWLHEAVDRPRRLRSGVDLDGLTNVRAAASAFLREDIIDDIAV